MTKIHGNEGYIAVGASELKVDTWEFEDSAPASETTEIGDAWESVEGGAPKSKRGTLVYYLKDADAAQAAVVAGATVTLTLYEQGNDSGKPYYTGSAYVESVNKPHTKTEHVKHTVNWRSTGTWSEGTV
jgi:hypothetical protein